jgi:universal stress protein E
MKVFSRVLFVADNAAEPSWLARGVELARAHQAQLTVLDVVPELAISARSSQELGGRGALLQQIVDARKLHLEKSLVEVGAREDVAVKVVVGRRYLEAIHDVLRHNHDLVLKRAESAPWLGRVFTSDDMHLLRKCPCPVWLLQAENTPAQRRVLAAIDLDPDAEAPDRDPLNDRILRYAAAAAAFESAELHVVHAWESPVAGFASLWADIPEEAERHYLDGEYRARQEVVHAIDLRLRDSLGAQIYEFLSPKFLLLHGRPELHIPQYAEQIQASVVVMGTVARTGIPSLFIGNTAEDILEQLRCGVLAIKPEHFVSPVRLEAD